MGNLIRPLVLIHGLWNSPLIFNRFLSRLDQPPSMVLAPFLPHSFGRKNIRSLAINLDEQIVARFGSDTPIDLLGFSMGGLIARVWLQEMFGYQRTIRFFSVASPHKGTLTAQLVPYHLFPGIAEMKIGSTFLRSLNSFPNYLYEVRCRSYFSYWDLMVFPGFRSILPIGPSVSVPVFTHKSLIKNFKAINLIANDVLGRSNI